MNRTIFYDIIRNSEAELFGGRLKKGQVGGIESILDSFAEHGDSRSKTLAYALATAHHETGARMVPVREGFATSDIQARALVADRPYGKPGATGQVYYGRGHVQLTWEANYRTTGDSIGIDLVREPDRMLEPEISARVLIEGLIDGRWNPDQMGIANYLPDAGADDLAGARQTVNLTDKWGLVAGYYRAYLGAIEAAGGIPSLAGDIRRPDDGFAEQSETIGGRQGIAGALIPVLTALIEMASRNDLGVDRAPAHPSGAIGSILARIKANATPAKRQLTPVNGWLGKTIGLVLDGKKTGIGILGVLLTTTVPALFPEIGPAILKMAAPGATDIQQTSDAVSQLLATLFSALTAWGVLGKMEKWVTSATVR